MQDLHISSKNSLKTNCFDKVLNLTERKSEWKYDGGITVSGLYNAEPMLVDDRNGDTAEDSPMLLVTYTSEKEYGAYRVILEEACVGGSRDRTDLYGRMQPR